MKFQFEGYEYEDGRDYIEIDFDFMEKSEFIKALEPDLKVPIVIPERFKKYQIDELKILLEKITGGYKLTEEDKYLCKSKVLKPLLEFFMIEKEIIMSIEAISEERKYYMIQQINFSVWHSERYEPDEIVDLRKEIMYQLKLNKLYDEVYISREDAIRGFKNKMLEALNGKNKKNRFISGGWPTYINEKNKKLLLPTVSIEDISDFRDGEFVYIDVELDELFCMRIIEINLSNITNTKYKYDSFKFNMYMPNWYRDDDGKVKIYKPKKEGYSESDEETDYENVEEYKDIYKFEKSNNFDDSDNSDDSEVSDDE